MPGRHRGGTSLRSSSAGEVLAHRRAGLEHRPWCTRGSGRGNRAAGRCPPLRCTRHAGSVDAWRACGTNQISRCSNPGRHAVRCAMGAIRVRRSDRRMAPAMISPPRSRPPSSAAEQAPTDTKFARHSHRWDRQMKRQFGGRRCDQRSAAIGDAPPLADLAPLPPEPSLSKPRRMDRRPAASAPAHFTTSREVRSSSQKRPRLLAVRQHRLSRSGRRRRILAQTTAPAGFQLSFMAVSTALGIRR